MGWKVAERWLSCLGVFAITITACSEGQGDGAYLETYMNEVTFPLEDFGWAADGTMWASAVLASRSLIFHPTYRYWSTVDAPDSSPKPGQDGSWFSKQYRQARGGTTWEVFPEAFEKDLEVLAVDSHGTAVGVIRANSTGWVLPAGAASWVALPTSTIIDQLLIDASGTVYFPTGSGWSKVEGGGLVPVSDAPVARQQSGKPWSLDGYQSDYAEVFAPGFPVLARVGPDGSQYYGQCYSGCNGSGNIAVSFILKEVKGQNPRTKAAR